ncbi:hypothetical protein B9Z19DRAFT_1126850 [Tuber borchii]|uniref:Uncharacterized protein n=1 Tax=Tuber borchii TaxID=42251 RepID=A0A2T6ZS92_TUBBO|nr:hypothetical protein B9Z19DRAFT_1126850 [Tuber borchii]
MPDFSGVRDAIAKHSSDSVLQHPIYPQPKGHLYTTSFYSATEFSEGGVLMADSWGVRHAITKPFYDGFLRDPICPLPKGRHHTSIFHGATESYSYGVKQAITKPFYNGVLRHLICPLPKEHPHTSIFHGATDQIPGALGMRSWSPFTTGFYTIQAVDRQKGVPIQAFSMVLQNSGGVKYAIAKPFYDGVLCHPICPPPKGRPHTSIFHGATESSEGGIPGALGMRSRSSFTTTFYTIQAVDRHKSVPIRAFSMALQSLLKGESLCWCFLNIWKALTLKPDSGGVRHAIVKPFYDGVLHHLVCPPPKGCPYTSISHGATEFSEGGVLMIPGALDMQSWSHFMTAFYTIQAVHHQKGVSIEGVSIALSPSEGGGL